MLWCTAASLTALFVGVYFAVLAALSGQVVAVRYRWVAVVVAVGAVLAAEPVRRRIQIRLERRFLGERGDPLRVLARLHATLSDGDQDEESVHSTITHTVATAVSSPSVSLALHRGPQIETVSITGTAQDVTLGGGSRARGSAGGLHRNAGRTRDAEDPVPRRRHWIVADGCGAGDLQTTALASADRT